MQHIFDKLNRISANLDQNGLFKEADRLDATIQQMATNPNLTPQQKTKIMEHFKNFPLSHLTKPIDPTIQAQILNPNWNNEQHDVQSIPNKAQQYNNNFIMASRETGLSVPLLLSLAQRESSFNPEAESSVGAYGLMQLYPAPQNVRSPQANILAGARKLKMYLDMFKDIRLALAAYNWGPTNLRRAGGRWRNVPSSVQKFANDVLSGMQYFRIN